MEKLNLGKPLDATCFACLTSTFFSCARLGEFTVLSVQGFHPSKHITIQNIEIIKDRQGNPTTVFHLLHTKTNPFGEDVYWKKQNIRYDPQKALANHIKVNKPTSQAHLFAYCVRSVLRPLTWAIFLVTIKKAARRANINFTFRHSLRIGGTLEYLLQGVPLDVIKRQGHWKSEAFSTYLRNHAQVLSPYLSQDNQMYDNILKASRPTNAPQQRGRSKGRRVA